MYACFQMRQNSPWQAVETYSRVSETPATATTPFIIVAYKCLPPLYNSVGPMVLDRSKLIGQVKAIDGLWTMCIGNLGRFRPQDQ